MWGFTSWWGLESEVFHAGDVGVGDVLWFFGGVSKKNLVGEVLAVIGGVHVLLEAIPCVILCRIAMLCFAFFAC